MTRLEKVIDFMQEEISTINLIYMHNNYCQETNNPDDEIFPMDMWDDIMDGFKSWDVATKIHFGAFNPFDKYFTFDGYGNIKTISEYLIEDNLYIRDMANWMIENKEDLGFSDTTCSSDLLYLLCEDWEEIKKCLN